MEMLGYHLQCNNCSVAAAQVNVMHANMFVFLCHNQAGIPPSQWQQQQQQQPQAQVLSACCLNPASPCAYSYLLSLGNRVSAHTSRDSITLIRFHNQAVMALSL